MYGGVLGEALPVQIKNTIRECNLAINVSATTKLEHTIMKALMAGDKKGGLEDVKAAEREFSTKYKLRKEDHCHQSLLKKRQEYWK